MRTRRVRLGLWALLGVGLFAGVAALRTQPLHAQAAASNPAAIGVEGTWQGTLHRKQGDMRVVVRIGREDGRLTSTIFLPDTKDSMDVDETTLAGDTLSLDLNADAASFSGTLAPDHNSLSGTYTQGGALPLVLVRATPETAWPLPEMPKPPAMMDPNADPSFEVATIKPTRPDEQNTRFSLEGAGHFYLSNQPLTTILQIVYGVQDKQIVGLPAWAAETRWDIDTKSDTPGQPTWDQVNIMMKKLLAERFALKLHTEQREMPAFVLSVAKGGEKMKRSSSTSVLYDSTGHGRGQMSFTNVTMKDFARCLQTGILDRPVVDQTGLGNTRFNFQLHWTPDDGKPTNPDQNPYPPLLVAMPEQTGIRLEATRTAVPVLVVDHVDKPSAN